jgi:hypothetical protein
MNPKDALLFVRLPESHPERLAFLRSYARELPIFERYVAGQRREAWAELEGLGDSIRSEQHLADAWAVALETMERARQNVMSVIERLKALGYRFHTSAFGSWESAPESPENAPVGLPPDPKAPSDPANQRNHMREMLGIKEPQTELFPPHAPPGRFVTEQLARLESRAGELPLSLRAWFQVVGAVNLIGVHPRIAPNDGKGQGDPLFVTPLDLVLEDIGVWQCNPESSESHSYLLPVSPDRFSKLGFAGGQAYSVRLPVLAADAPFKNERHQLSFLNYLRLSFEFGGFAGWADADEPPDEIKRVAAGLLPL